MNDDRVVSFLELFYDLVFVVIIARISHTLAGDVSWIGIRNFAIVFSLIWIAWINGSMYHELHGREDGRHRSSIFVQMALLVVLSVYAAGAADDPSDGRGFAIVYAILLTVVSLQWFGLRRHDSPEMATMTGQYVAGLALIIGIVIVSALVNSPSTRLALWAGVVGVTVVGIAAQAIGNNATVSEALRVTESMAERFGLFTIIVLGEVVVGVGDGLAETERTGRAIATGMLALSIGFGFWWNYFDFLGRRQPRNGLRTRMLWVYGHFPLGLAIAAAGAGMVSLIEHAAESRTPTDTSWLIAGATAGILASLAILVTTMPHHPGRRLVPYTLAAGAVIALILGALRPAPVVLAASLSVVLMAAWCESFVRHARHGTSMVEH